MLNKIPLMVTTLIIVFLITSLMTFIAIEKGLEKGITATNIIEKNKADMQTGLPKTASGRVSIGIARPVSGSGVVSISIVRPNK